MLRNMHNPAYRDNIGEKMEELKKDPEIGNILEEIQTGGPAAMMKCAPQWLNFFLRDLALAGSSKSGLK